MRRILGFAFIPGLTMVSTILVLPLISSRFGPAGWSAVGLGQSLGAFLSITAGLAWQVVGAQQVAIGSQSERQVIYAESIKSRGLVFCLIGPFAAGACYVLAPGYRWESVAFMVATGLNCFNASWFFAGTGQPKYVIRNEAIVRLAGYLAAIPAILLSDSLWAYAVILILTGLIMATANIVSVFNPFGVGVWKQTRKSWHIVREHLPGMVSRIFSAGQQYLGITLVSIFFPQGLPVYAALDNMQKTANNATSFFPQAFAWWVGSPKVVFDRRPRVRKMVFASLFLGLCVLLGWLLLGPVIVRWLYHGEVDASWSLHLWTALGMAGFTVSRALGQLCLVPLVLQHLVYRGATVCAAVGLPAMVVCLWFGGIDGALFATAVAYLGLCIFYLCAIYGGLHSSDSPPSSAGETVNSQFLDNPDTSR